MNIDKNNFIINFLVIVIIIFGFWDLYFLDYQIYNDYFYFTLKYLLIPCLIIAYFIAKIMVKNSAKPNSKSFLLVLILLFWFPIIGICTGYVSLLNRFIGKQTDVEIFFKAGNSKYSNFATNLLITMNGEKESLTIPSQDNILYENGQSYKLKLKKGSLGLKYLVK